MHRVTRVCLAALAALSAACASYDFERQDVAFRHLPETDTLELIVVSHGLLETGRESGGEVAADAEGARHVILFGWPFEFDLPDIEESLVGADPAEHPLAERAAVWLSGIEVDSAVVWSDEDGKSSLYQRLRVPHASEGLALLSELINAECVKDAEWENLPPTFDARTRELFEAHARGGVPWAAFERRGLVVRLPGSPAAAARFLAEAVEVGDEGVKALAAALTELSVADGVIELAFLPDATGWVRLTLRRKPGEDDKPLSLPESARLGAPPRDVLDLFELPRSKAVAPEDR